MRSIFSLMLVTGLAVGLVGCDKAKEAVDSAKSAGDLASKISALKALWDKESKPIGEKMSEMTEKAKTAAGAEKETLDSTIKESTGMMDTIKEKLGGLAAIKDMAAFDKIKEEVEKLIAQLKTKVGL